MALFIWELLAFVSQVPSIGYAILGERGVYESDLLPGVLSPESLLLHATLVASLLALLPARSPSGGGILALILVGVSGSLPLTSLLFRALGLQTALDFVSFTRFGIATELTGILFLLVIGVTHCRKPGLGTSEGLVIGGSASVVGLVLTARIPEVLRTEVACESVVGLISLAALGFFYGYAVIYWLRSRRAPEALEQRKETLMRALSVNSTLVAAVGEDISPSLQEAADDIEATSGQIVPEAKTTVTLLQP